MPDDINSVNPQIDSSEAAGMNYGDYLHINELLASQRPVSDAHDEMLFIIQHQTSELWMRLVIHEINAARGQLQKGMLQPSFKMLSRVARIFDQLNSAWDVLRTMTPSDYTRFREALGSSSGFQSHQYRLIEYALGNRNASLLKIHAASPERYALLENELTQPSLYQQALVVLSENTKIEFSADVYQLDQPYVHNHTVMQAWAMVYQSPEKHWDLYELAEKLVDLEDYFRRWRFNHVTTVERVIGFKRGTGGTSGVEYLRRMLDVVLFPELWNVRGEL